METAEIIKLLPNLSIDDRLIIANIALNSIEAEDRTKVELQLDRQLKIAANLAVDDYNHDRELTIFTSLDGEEFLEQYFQGLIRGEQMLRGEVWLVNLDSTVDSEIRKTRPCVIVNDDAIGVLPLKVIVPITDWKESFRIRPWMVRIEPDSNNGLIKLSAADAFQIRSLAESRLVEKLGSLSDLDLALIEKALTVMLKLRQSLWLFRCSINDINRSLYYWLGESSRSIINIDRMPFFSRSI